MIKLAFMNQKGGVGKSTASFIIAGELAITFGKRVLVVDGDEQRSVTNAFLSKDEEYLESPESCKDIVDVLGGARVADCIRSVTYIKKGLFGREEGEYNIDILPARAEQNDVTLENYLILREKLQEVEPFYDYVIIDLPPALTDIAASLLATTDYVVAPVEVGLFSLMGYSDLLDSINSIQSSLNPSISILGLFFSRVNENAKFHNHIINAFEGKIFETRINNSIKVQECPMEAPLCIYAPSCKAAKQYRELTKEIMQDIDNHEKQK